MAVMTAARAPTSGTSVWTLAALAALLVWVALMTPWLITARGAWPAQVNNALNLLLVWALPVLAALVTRLQHDDLQHLRRWRLLILLLVFIFLAQTALALAMTQLVQLLLATDLQRTLIYPIISIHAYLLQPLVAAWMARLALRLSWPGRTARRPGVMASLLAIAVALTLGALYSFEPGLSRLLATYLADDASQALALPLQLAAAWIISLPVTLALWPLLQHRAIAAGRFAIACALLAIAALWLAQPMATLLPDAWPLTLRAVLLLAMVLVTLFVACAVLLRFASRPRLPA